MSGQMVPEGFDSASAHTLVIFGGSGDLAARKLVPALYNLRQSNLLPEPLAVVGLGRRELDDQSYRDRLRTATREFSRTGSPDEDSWTSFERGLYFVRGDFGVLSGFEYIAICLKCSRLVN